MASPLDGGCQFPLVLRACAGLAPWADLAVFRNEAAQEIGILIIDHRILVYTELTNLRSGHIAPERRLLVLIGVLVTHMSFSKPAVQAAGLPGLRPPGY